MNRENFKKVLDHIKAHPESWDQGQWHSDCGTAHCFAGHAHIMSGNPMWGFANVSAMKYLGLTDSEASYLFGMDRKIEDFERVLSHGVFDFAGRDAEGYDSDGFDRDGYDRRGYNAGGYGRTGEHKDAYFKMLEFTELNCGEVGRL